MLDKPLTRKDLETVDYEYYNSLQVRLQSGPHCVLLRLDPRPASTPAPSRLTVCPATLAHSGSSTTTLTSATWA